MSLEGGGSDRDRESSRRTRSKGVCSRDSLRELLESSDVCRTITDHFPLQPRFPSQSSAINQQKCRGLTGKSSNLPSRKKKKFEEMKKKLEENLKGKLQKIPQIQTAASVGRNNEAAHVTSQKDQKHSSFHRCGRASAI